MSYWRAMTQSKSSVGQGFKLYGVKNKEYETWSFIEGKTTQDSRWRTLVEVLGSFWINSGLYFNESMLRKDDMRVKNMDFKRIKENAAIMECLHLERGLPVLAELIPAISRSDESGMADKE